MKTFKPGDRVRFLSTKGSGVVKSAEKGIVHVLIEDGFEIPVEASDLVIIEPQVGGKRNPFLHQGEFAVTEPSEVKEKQEIKSNDNDKEEQDKKLHQSVPEKGLYLVLVPVNQQTLVSGDVDVYLVNFSTFGHASQVMIHDSRQGFCTRWHGLAGPGEAVLIDSVPHSALSAWSKMRIHGMYLDHAGSRLFPAETFDLELKTSKLIKEDVYQLNPFFDELAHVIFVAQVSEPEAGVTEQHFEDPTAHEKQKSSQLIDRFITEPGFAEVDLHIEKLRSDYRTMPQNDIMKTQIGFFRQCLESAIKANLNRVVFIHGVGVGMLKKELHDILKEYPDIAFGVASLLKYGTGATEVFLQGK